MDNLQASQKSHWKVLYLRHYLQWYLKDEHPFQYSQGSSLSISNFDRWPSGDNTKHIGYSVMLTYFFFIYVRFIQNIIKTEAIFTKLIKVLYLFFYQFNILYVLEFLASYFGDVPSTYEILSWWEQILRFDHKKKTRERFYLVHDENGM